jgi:F-type H+-transporting ATPase subunit b
MDAFIRHISKPAAALFCLAVYGIHDAFASPETAGGHGEPHGEAHGEITVEGADAGHGVDAAHGAPHESAGLPQLDVSTYPGQIFWLAVTFAILYFYFSRKALPEISGVIENRHEHIQSNLHTAEKLRKEADEAQAHYEALLEHARTESSKLMNDAAANVKAKGERMFLALREKGAQDIAALEQRLAQEKAKAMAEMDMIAAEIASQAAEKIVGVKADLKQAQTVVQSLNRREAA